MREISDAAAVKSMCDSCSNKKCFKNGGDQHFPNKKWKVPGYEVYAFTCTSYIRGEDDQKRKEE